MCSPRIMTHVYGTIEKRGAPMSRRSLFGAVGAAALAAAVRRRRHRLPRHRRRRSSISPMCSLPAFPCGPAPSSSRCGRWRG